MKKLKKSLNQIVAAIVLIAAVVIPAKAQTFYGLSLVTGTNSAPILLHFLTQSNPAPIVIQPQTLLVTNILTNEQITVSYASQMAGLAGTNLLALTTLTTHFNGATGWTVFPTNWLFNVPGGTYYPTVSPWGTIGIVNTNFPSGTQTNGVSLQ